MGPIVRLKTSGGTDGAGPLALKVELSALGLPVRSTLADCAVTRLDQSQRLVWQWVQSSLRSVVAAENQPHARFDSPRFVKDVGDQRFIPFFLEHARLAEE